MYRLSNAEKARLTNGIRAAYAIPLIDDLEDFIFEAILTYVKQIPLVDPLTNIRSKQLFDVVDVTNRIGWSVKTLQWSIKPACEFELVIQRADIFKKSNELGFEELSKGTPPNTLGKALLRHWGNKVTQDAQAQKVTDSRVSILLKSRDKRTFAYYEDDFDDHLKEEIYWRWTNNAKTGLQGIRRRDDFCVFRWYPNQKQFFERFQLPRNAYIFNLEPQRLPLDDVIQLLLKRLDSRP